MKRQKVKVFTKNTLNHSSLVRLSGDKNKVLTRDIIMIMMMMVGYSMSINRTPSNQVGTTCQSTGLPLIDDGGVQHVNQQDSL